MHTHQGVREWDYFWMKVNGQTCSRSTFTAPWSQTTGWQPVHEVILELVWNNGSLKPQKCVEQRCWTLSITCFALQMQFHCSSQLADVTIAMDSSIPLVGLTLSHKPFHRRQCITVVTNGIACLRAHDLSYPQRPCCSLMYFSQTHFSSFRSPQS